MEHFYEKIDGFFDYQELYSNIVLKLENNSHIVEIGAYKGKSTAYMAVEIINSGKNIRFDVVDNWCGGTDAVDYYTNDPDMVAHNYNIFDFFKSNVKDVLHIINPIQSSSDIAAEKYADKSLDFVFIDANHTYEYVIKDIKAWFPKMKPGSIIAGHDYNNVSWAGVIKAVHEFFTDDQVKVIGSCWAVNV